MNQYPSRKEAQGIVLSTTLSPRLSSPSVARRLVSAVTFATLALAAAACSHSNPSVRDQVAAPSGDTALVISALHAPMTPMYGEIGAQEPGKGIDISEGVPPDYLTRVLRDLPWSER
jgi:hypothetical protein